MHSHILHYTKLAFNSLQIIQNNTVYQPIKQGMIVDVYDFINRRRLCQLIAAILTSDLTSHNVDFMKRHSDYHATIQRRVDPNSMDARVAMT